RVERRAVGPSAGLVNRDDAGVLEPSGDEGLAQEASLLETAAGDQFLDCDISVEDEVAGARHSAEAAAAMLPDDLVALRVMDLDTRERTSACPARGVSRAGSGFACAVHVHRGGGR